MDRIRAAYISRRRDTWNASANWLVLHAWQSARYNEVWIGLKRASEATLFMNEKSCSSFSMAVGFGSSATFQQPQNVLVLVVHQTADLAMRQNVLDTQIL